MAMSRPKSLVLVGSGAAILALGIAVPTVAFAQDPSPSPSTSTSDTRAADHEQRRAEHRDQLAEALAKELGLSKEQVAAALDKVDDQLHVQANAERQDALKQRLAEAVTAKKLTQAEADAILKAAEAGVMLGGGGVGGPGMGGPGGHGMGR